MKRRGITVLAFTTLFVASAVDVDYEVSEELSAEGSADPSMAQKVIKATEEIECDGEYMFSHCHFGWRLWRQSRSDR